MLRQMWLNKNNINEEKCLKCIWNNKYEFTLNYCNYFTEVWNSFREMNFFTMKIKTIN